jgi:hypothetical protein
MGKSYGHVQLALDAYDTPKTPLDCVLACKEVRPEVVARLKALRERLDPFDLFRGVDA